VRPELLHRHLGRLDYDTVWELQRGLRAQRLASEGSDTLLTVEHDPPVLTAGRRAVDTHLRVDRSQLARDGIQVRAVERGGDWTWHGPGQLVAYPIVALKAWNLRVTGFVEGLERAMAEVVRRTLERGADPARCAELAIGRRCGFPGTWVRRGDGSRAKLGAVGVHMRRFVSLHGLALNLDPRPWGFDRIVPCGLQDEVSSVARLLEEIGGEPEAVPSVEEAAGWLADLLPRAWGEPLSLSCDSIE